MVITWYSMKTSKVDWCFHLRQSLYHSSATECFWKDTHIQQIPTHKHTHPVTPSKYAVFLNCMTACLMSAVEQIGAISRCRLRCNARLRKLASISIMTLAGKDNGPLTPSLPAFYELMFTPPWHQPLISTFVLVRPKLAMLSLLANAQMEAHWSVTNVMSLMIAQWRHRENRH